MAAAIARAKHVRIVRALMRYAAVRGGLLSGGVAYAGLFSIAAALTIAWTVFMRLLGGNEALRGSVVDGINSALPGLLQDDSGHGLISADALVLDSAITPATVIAVPVLLWTSTSVMQALASSVRAVFGITTLRQNVAMVRVRALGGFVVLAAGIVASALLTLVSASAGRTILAAVGVEGTAAGTLVRGAGLLASFGIDALVVVFLIRVMSAVRVPRRDLVAGALLASLALTILRLAGTSLLGSVSGNALLASFAALATILLWLNLATRVFLMSAAYMANPPAPYVPLAPGEVHAKASPNFVTLSDPRTLAWPHDPLNGGVLPEEGTQGLAAYYRDLPGEASGGEMSGRAGVTGEPGPDPDMPGSRDVSGSRDASGSGGGHLRIGDMADDGPRWGGLAGNLARRRMERTERKALKAIEKALEAQDDYQDGVRRAAGQE
ncbi:MAG: YihY/virulence factor BrkB family protein [Actinomycetaceae bacterium]|nr:YihY/virulence factor BrkB family protein [Actinomycetaceae bacterium]